MSLQLADKLVISTRIRLTIPHYCGIDIHSNNHVSFWWWQTIKLIMFYSINFGFAVLVIACREFRRCVWRQSEVSRIFANERRITAPSHSCFGSVAVNHHQKHEWLLMAKAVIRNYQGLCSIRRMTLSSNWGAVISAMGLSPIQGEIYLRITLLK